MGIQSGETCSDDRDTCQIQRGGKALSIVGDFGAFCENNPGNVCCEGTQDDIATVSGSCY